MDEETELSRVSILTERIAALSQVERFTRDGEPGGWRVAYALSEIRYSALEVAARVDKMLGSDPDQIADLMAEIGVHLDHIKYHIADSGWFGYLCENKCVAQAERTSAD